MSLSHFPYLAVVCSEFLLFPALCNIVLNAVTNIGIHNVLLADSSPVKWITLRSLFLLVRLQCTETHTVGWMDLLSQDPALKIVESCRIHV